MATRFAWATAGGFARAVHASSLGRKVLRITYRQLFDHAVNVRRIFAGIYPTYAAACAAVPDGRRIGFDNEPTARSLLGNRDALYASDYPVMLWLTKLLDGAVTVFDFGGSVGVSFFAYRSRIDYPHELRWLVCDVPSVVRIGRTLQQEDALGRLSFTTRIEDGAGCDVLLVSGVLQYLEDPWATVVRLLQSAPPHAIFNKLPLTNGPAFVTLENFGTGYSPYQVLNREAFFDLMHEHGYTPVDAWENPDVGLIVPGYPANTLDALSGACFRRTGAGGA